jgi:hypothetical protein
MTRKNVPSQLCAQSIPLETLLLEGPASRSLSLDAQFLDGIARKAAKILDKDKDRKLLGHHA